MKIPQLLHRGALTLLLGASFALGAQAIRLGSLAPADSPWDLGLKRIAAEWSTISKGSVTLKIYPGGIVGDEMDMIRKMRIGQLNAAGLTGIGLCRILPTILNIQAPMLIRTDEQLACVLDSLRPVFEKGLEEKGFVVLSWQMVGWVHFFSKMPIVTPADLKKQKLFVWAGDADAVQIWKEMGFHPVPLAVTDLMSSLQSGMVDCYSATSLSSASYQWFGLAKNMCGMNWAPLIGGLVVSSNSWSKIPADLRPKLLESAQKISAQMQNEIRAKDAEALSIMKQNGLTVTSVSPQDEAAWKSVVDSGIPKLYGKSFDKAIFEAITGYLQGSCKGK